MVDFVIIGLNSEKYLGECIKSCLEVTKEYNVAKIIYVDGGSDDNSINIADELGVTTIIYEGSYPSPGIQRNIGFKASKNKYIMFLDSDTIVNKEFVVKALDILKNGIGVGGVFGRRIEKYPTKNFYHVIANIEWNKQIGTAKDFGGDVVLKREAVQLTGGYNEELIGGEDPELARRIIKLGYEIIGLDTTMTIHDINMNSIKSYLKRAYRSGYGFGAVHYFHKEYWILENKRILIRGFLSILCFFMIFFNFLFIILFVLILFKPRIFNSKRISKELDLDKFEGKIYLYHSSIVVIPQFFGLIRFYLGLLLKKPLVNKRRKR